MCSIHGGSSPEDTPGPGPAWGEVQRAVARLADADGVGWSDEQVRHGLRALLATADQLGAAISLLVGSFDARGLAQADGFRSTRTWLTAFGRMSQGAAGGWLARGRLLRQLPGLAAAARAGGVSAEHLRKVADLAEHIGVTALRPVERILAELAGQAGPGEMDKACQRIRAHVDPDGPEPDPDAGQRRGLSISRVGSLFAVSGRLDAEGGATVLTALDALTPPPAPDDSRTAAQRRADAMVELARHALSRAAVPAVGGVRAQLGLLITPETLLTTTTLAPDGPPADADPVRPDPGSPPAGVGRAGSPPRDTLECAGVPPAPELPWADWGARLPVAVAQRIACDCEVWRAALDPATGLPLEVGRAHRLVPYWIRKALHARDRGCRWPGCTAPTSWTDAHHLVAWYYGGPTNVDNLLLLCRYHHGLVHEGQPPGKQWRITLDHTTGEVRVHRPDGTPYELGPSQPWTGPTTQRMPAVRTRTERVPTDGVPTKGVPVERAPTEHAPTERAPTERAPTQRPRSQPMPADRKFACDGSEGTDNRTGPAWP